MIAATNDAPLIERAKPFMQIFKRLGVRNSREQARLTGRLAREFGPTQNVALEIMAHESVCVLEQEARRVLCMESE